MRVGQFDLDWVQEPVHAENHRVGEPGRGLPDVRDDGLKRVSVDEPGDELVRERSVFQHELPGHAHAGGHPRPCGPQLVPVQVHAQVENRGPAGLGPFHGAARQHGLEQFVDHGPQPCFFHGPPGQVRTGLNRFGGGLLDQRVLGHLKADQAGLEPHRLVVHFDLVVAGVVPVLHHPREDGGCADGVSVPGGEPADRAGEPRLPRRAGNGEAAPGEGGRPLLREADEGEFPCGEGGAEFDGGCGGAVDLVGSEGGGGDEAGDGEGGDDVGAVDLHGWAPQRQAGPHSGGVGAGAGWVSGTG